VAKKLTKKEIKEPDAFISTVDRISEALYEHRRPIYIAVGALLAIGIVYSATEYYQKTTERKGQTALYEVEAEYEMIKEDFEGAMAAEPSDEKDKVDSKLKQASGNIEQDYGKVIKGFEKVIKEHSSTNASVLASIKLAKLYEDYNQQDKALEVLQKATKRVDSGDLFFAFVHTQIGNLLLEKNDCNKAIEHWQKVTKSKDLKFSHAPVLLKTGLCYEKLGQVDKAKSSYEKITKDFDSTTSADSARKYLRMLSTKSENTNAKKNANDKGTPNDT
jgi:tetratricopeptide (TPR) repeat protein